MTFADKYSKHAYADLIREAETQGIGLGARAERERIKQIIQDWFDYDCDTSRGSKNLMEWIDEETITSIVQDNDVTYIMGDNK